MEKHIVCRVSDVAEEGLKEFTVSGKSILIVNHKGVLSAIGGKCSHLGAPLVKGVLNDKGQVRCPWHGACFNATSGDIEDFPGLDCVPAFDVAVEGDDVILRGPPASFDPSSNKRLKQSSSLSGDEKSNVFLIIGGGPCAVVCAETLRQHGFHGKIIMTSADSKLPYNRPVLSKFMHTKFDDICLRKAEFYTLRDINVLLNKTAVFVDFDNKKVFYEDGSKLGYSKLFIATGSIPRKIPIPGHEHPAVFCLRSFQDANYISKTCLKKRVVIVGSSFIGMEVASYLSSRAESVVVVGRNDVPFKLTLGSEVGAILQRLLENGGVKFELETTVSKIVAKNGNVLSQIVLGNGKVLNADYCILGVGGVPNTKFLLQDENPFDYKSKRSSGLLIGPIGDVQVDERMCTNIPGVYAGGDMVTFPLRMPWTPEPIMANIGHYQVAHKHGQVAALNMLGQDVAVDTVPYFWTVLQGKSVRFAGFNRNFDSVVLHSPTADKFAAFYIKDEVVMAVASLNYDPLVSTFANYLGDGKVVQRQQISEDPWGFKYYCDNEKSLDENYSTHL